MHWMSSLPWSLSGMLSCWSMKQMYSWRSVLLVIYSVMPWYQRFCGGSSKFTIWYLSNGFAHIFTRYFQGILFLTTNRVKTFDHAFQSRIHLLLHYDNLSCTAKEEIWMAFLRRVQHNISADQIREISKKDMNGRQIKNTMKLAVALSNREQESLCFGHLLRTMRVIEAGSKEKNISALTKANIRLLGYIGLGVLSLCFILYHLCSK